MAKSEPSCQVLAVAMEVQGDLSRLAASMHRLRRAMRRCTRCADQNCPLMQELSTAIRNALFELTEEWDL